MCNFDYIKNRLKPQINYYNKTAAKNKKSYIMLSTFVILINAAIPVLTGFLETPNQALKAVIAILSASATVLTSFLLLTKAKENWMQYREICENLKSELAKFQFQSTPNYSLNDLINNCESAMAAEHRKWYSNHHSINS